MNLNTNLRIEKRNRINLVDFDSKIPNLALMKLSTWHKQQGDVVGINLPNPDKTYVSVIFRKNREQAIGLGKFFECITIGGCGYDYAVNLSDEIEHIMPDYQLYNCDYSMGYTSRGCIRKCQFCIVPIKEGGIKDNAPITEFWNPEHKKVILLDNNFLASPKWYENLKFLQERKLKVNFHQGLDIRLITDENAEELAKTMTYNWKFNSKTIHFAFDDTKYEKAVRNGLDILKNHGVRMGNLMFYVLAGFGESGFEDTYQRAMMLWEEYGCYPFIMRFHHNDKKINSLTRWINRRYFKYCKFEDFGKKTKVCDLLTLKQKETAIPPTNKFVGILAEQL